MFRILSDPPEGERWEFPTGSIVRCRKQRFSDSEELVAFESV
jgi:hypothetical protein